MTDDKQNDANIEQAVLYGHDLNSSGVDDDTDIPGVVQPKGKKNKAKVDPTDYIPELENDDEFDDFVDDF